MRCTTWTGNIVNGKVLPIKSEKIIDNNIIAAMQDKLSGKIVTL